MSERSVPKCCQKKVSWIAGQLLLCLKPFVVFFNLVEDWSWEIVILRSIFSSPGLLDSINSAIESLVRLEILRLIIVELWFWCSIQFRYKWEIYWLSTEGCSINFSSNYSMLIINWNAFIEVYIDIIGCASLNRLFYLQLLCCRQLLSYYCYIYWRRNFICEKLIQVLCQTPNFFILRN